MPRVRHNILANVLGRVWSCGLAFVLVPVYLQFLGVEAYALVGFHALLLNLAGMFDLGLGTTLNRELARCSIEPERTDRGHELLRTLETVYVLLGVLVAGVIFVGAGLLANRWLQGRTLPSATLVVAVRLISLAILLQLLSSFYQAGLMGLEKQALANGVWAATATFRGLLTVCVLGWIRPSIEAFFVCQVIAVGLGAAAHRVLLTRALGPGRRITRFRWRILVQVRRFTAGVCGNTVAGVGFNQLDKLLLSRMLVLDALGYYMLASTVVSLLASTVLPVNRATFPRYAQLWEQCDRGGLARLHHHSCQLVSVIVLPAVVMLTLFARPVMFAWTGGSAVAENTHRIVAILAVGTACSAMAARFGQLLFASGRPHVLMWVNAASVVAFVPLFVALVGPWGVLGAAAAWSIVTVLGKGFILIPYVGRVVLKEPLTRWLVTDVLMPLAPILALGSVVRHVLPEPTSRWASVGYLSALWLSMSIIAILATGHIRKIIFDVVRVHIVRPRQPVSGNESTQIQ